MIVKEHHIPTGEIAYCHINCFAEAMGMSEREVESIGDGKRRYGRFLISLVANSDVKCIYCNNPVVKKGST